MVDFGSDDCRPSLMTHLTFWEHPSSVQLRAKDTAGAVRLTCRLGMGDRRAIRISRARRLEGSRTPIRTAVWALAPRRIRLLHHRPGGHPFLFFVTA